MGKRYRKIYEEHYGNIPVDAEGRTYDIHHIDGNRKNNDPSNLIALPKKDHYELHLNQGDYAAALFLSASLELTVEQISDLAKKSVEKQMICGNFAFTSENAKIWQSELLKQGTHHFQSSAWQSWANKQKSKNGNLPAQIQSQNGSHPWLGVGNAKGRVWVTDGTIDRLVYPNNIPQGFKKGRSKAKTRKERKQNGLGQKKSTTQG